jgi:hypothetical protein
LLASEIGPGMTDLTRGAVSARVAFLGPERQNVALDDQAWVVTRRDADWLIASSNAISEILP